FSGRLDNFFFGITAVSAVNIGNHFHCLFFNAFAKSIFVFSDEIFGKTKQLHQKVITRFIYRQMIVCSHKNFSRKNVK
ncbi:MAG: hypothetical protein Q8P60_17250, partial [Pseudorhodobacter sp.]|nr:hypothetical protein [Pseudorhodobacter sp.]